MDPLMSPSRLCLNSSIAALPRSACSFNSWNVLGRAGAANVQPCAAFLLCSSLPSVVASSNLMISLVVRGPSVPSSQHNDVI